MIDDMETEVEMLERHRYEAWAECGLWVGRSWAVTIDLLVMMGLFFSAFHLGPQEWMLWAVLGTIGTDIILSHLLSKHFSKKYMRLANGE